MPGSGTRGQALTEFIIVIPLFLLLLLGVVQLSMLTFAQQTVHYAAFAATRAAIVRPCAAFHPDNDIAPNFTPAVFSAAVLATLAAAPAQQLFPGLPYAWLPILPDTPEVLGLDFETQGSTVRDNMYANAAFLTAVRRVEPDTNENPVSWERTDAGPGMVPCAPPSPLPWQSPDEFTPHQQNVPPPGTDLSLEVTFLFPMRIFFVNRIFYGIFVNFHPAHSTSVAEELGLTPIDEGARESVMIYPIRGLPPVGEYKNSVSQMVDNVMEEYRFSGESKGADIAGAMNERNWYPLPVRARCTLTAEGSLVPLVNSFPWPH